MTGALFVDLKKAFDTVPHDCLLKKLDRLGIQDNSMRWFKSYLMKRTQVVDIGNQFSDPMNVLCGDPQGSSVLGPILFIPYINDMPSSIQYSKVMMCLDDIVIFYSSRQMLHIRQHLNLDLMNLSN